MAKTKTPFFSLGSRGSIGRNVTTQKRGSKTLIRSKPIPTDPESDAQLAQRQIYRDAVAAWHALSLEEQQAWRGVCPGLTAYQCFMRTELKPAPPLPPPEEHTEEQTEVMGSATLYSGASVRRGQRLTIANRTVSKLAFYLKKTLIPTGDVTFSIRKVSDGSIIASKVWGDAGSLQTDYTWEEVEFDTPVTINEEVYIAVEFYGGNVDYHVACAINIHDVKADEYMIGYIDSWWEATGKDGVYKYTWTEPA